MIRFGRYKEKETGEHYECTNFHYGKGINRRIFQMKPIGPKTKELSLTEEEIESRFEFDPYGNPVIQLLPIEQKHPILIRLHCPECNSLLRRSSISEEHVCSKAGCYYHTSISSIYSGMYALVTDEQEKLINEGIYSETLHGKITEITEYEASLYSILKNMDH